MPEKLPQRVLAEPCGSTPAQEELPTVIGLPGGGAGLSTDLPFLFPALEAMLEKGK